MKKQQTICLILCTLSFLPCTTSYAQKFTLGVKAGATLSVASFGNKDDKDQFTNLWKPGFFGAGLINFPMKKNFSYQAEVGFSQRGRKIEFNERTWSNNAIYHYIDLSMVLRKSYPLNWASDVKGTWFFNVGPRVSYWLSGKGTVTSGGSYDYTVDFGAPPEEPFIPDFDKMYMYDVNRWLFGLDFGIGVDAPTRAMQKFVIELRFTSGHTYFGSKDGAFNRTLGFADNLKANEKIISLSIDYTITREVNQSKKGKSTKTEIKKGKPRKNIDSMIH
jgi:Outer membrane protein beta-barrel domain